jgi:hypothetical protein
MSGGPISKRPWLWVIAAFLALITAWTILITIASKNKPADVPVITMPAKGADHGQQP